MGQTKILSYPVIADDISMPNDNAVLLSAVCNDNAMVLVTTSNTKRNTFSERGLFGDKVHTWISEVDICMASRTMIKYIDNFSVVQCVDLPSDHAPITLTVANTGVDLNNLLMRSSQLGDHAALYGCAGRGTLFRKPLKFTNIDKEVFYDKILQRDLSLLTENTELSDVECGITNALYACVQESVCRNQRSDEVHMQVGRWEKLLSDKDDSRVWKAIYKLEG